MGVLLGLANGDRVAVPVEDHHVFSADQQIVLRDEPFPARRDPVFEQERGQFVAVFPLENVLQVVFG